MTTYGYARVSSDDQDLTLQREALTRAGCAMIREEKVSGGSRDGREQLQILLDFLQPGDVLVVTKFDRLGRNLIDMLNIGNEIGKKGAHLRSMAENVDTTSPMGVAMFQMMGVFAELERGRIRERQREGIAKAKSEGVYKGGTVKHDPAKIVELFKAGKSKAEIVRELGCHKMTVYRALENVA